MLWLAVPQRCALIAILVIGCGGKTTEPDRPGAEQDAASEERSPKELAAAFDCQCGAYFGAPIPLSSDSADAQSCRFELPQECPAEQHGFNSTLCSRSINECADEVQP